MVEIKQVNGIYSQLSYNWPLDCIWINDLGQLLNTYRSV